MDPPPPSVPASAPYVQNIGAGPSRPGRIFTNRPDFTFTTADINGAKRPVAFPGSRSVNPLDPQYALPSCPPGPPAPAPKFIRDSLDVSDLGPWSRPFSANARASSTRNPLDVSDIQGATRRGPAPSRAPPPPIEGSTSTPRAPRPATAAPETSYAAATSTSLLLGSMLRQAEGRQFGRRVQSSRPGPPQPPWAHEDKPYKPSKDAGALEKQQHQAGIERVKREYRQALFDQANGRPGPHPAALPARPVITPSSWRNTGANARHIRPHTAHPSTRGSSRVRRARAPLTAPLGYGEGKLFSMQDEEILRDVRMLGNWDL